MKYTLIASPKTPKMAEIYRDAFRKLSIVETKEEHKWDDYDIMIYLKAIPLNFGKYNMSYSPFPKKIQNDKGGYINNLPINHILGSKHILDLNSLDCYPQSITIYDYLDIRKNKFGKYDYYIIKPSLLSQGEGITISDSRNLIRNIEKYDKPMYPLVVQKYITNPLLLNGHKMDFGVYVLYIDQKIYVNKYFFTRISPVKYQSHTERTSGITTLDNDVYYPEKFFDEYIKYYPKDDANILHGNLAQKFIDVIKSYFTLVMKNVKMDFWNDKKNHYFNLFRFDLLLDTDGKIWLLEINKNPGGGKDYGKGGNYSKIILDMIKIILNKHNSSFFRIHF